LSLSKPVWHIETGFDKLSLRKSRPEVEPVETGFDKLSQRRS
jgi:hypothetical protein